MRNNEIQSGIQFPVDHARNAVLDVALADELGLRGIVPVSNGCILAGQLENLEAFKAVFVVGIADQRIHFFVIQGLVVRALAVAHHDNQLAVQLLHGQIWSIRSVQDLETVVKQGLGLVVRDNYLFNRCKKTLLVVFAFPNHTRRDEVYCARCQGERTCIVQTALVLFVVRRLKPVQRYFRIVLKGRVKRVAGVGKLGSQTGTVLREAVAVGRVSGAAWVLYHQRVAVSPARLHVVVKFRCVAGVARGGVAGIVVHKARHDNTLVQAGCGVLGLAHAVGIADTVHTAVPVVVLAVKVIGKGTLEEVHGHGRWVEPVSNWTFVVVVRIVHVAQSTGDVATDNIVGVVAQIRVKPRREIRIGQTESRLVQNTVVVERHVVDLVVRAKCKGLRTNFEAQRTGTGLGVDVSAVVVHPPKGHVAVQHVGLFLAAVKGPVKIVRRVILQGVVAVVSVQVDEGCQGVGQVAVYSVGGPLQDDFGDAAFVAWKLLAGIAIGVVFAQQPSAVQLYLFAVDNPVAVVFVANVFVDRSQTVGRQRAGPKVIAS